jgi:hypothetical protein
MPEVEIVKRVPRGRKLTIEKLCLAAGIECRVTGQAADRVIYLSQTSRLRASREPGPFGPVAVGVAGGNERRRAVLALGVLAYAVFDYAARESMRGRPEARFALPVGRPRKARPLSGAERQRRWRSRSGS